MVISFDKRITDLETRKQNLNISVLNEIKSEYNQKTIEILEGPIEELDSDSALSKLKELKEYHSRIKEIDNQIEHIPEITEELDNKINFLKNRQERIRNLPLERNTEKLIAETFKWDTVYQYAREIWDEELIKKMEKRSLSVKKYTDILEKDYRRYMENMYDKLFPDDQPKPESTSRKYFKLPKWMIEKIRKDLNNNKILEVSRIESFLKNELKKNNWKIRIAHIKSTFAENYNEALKYISGLIINYSEFSLIENNEFNNQTLNKKKKSKHENLKSSVSGEVIGNNRFDRLNRENLLARAFSIKEIDKLETRISKYIDLFEELEYNFSNRKVFEKELNEAIAGHTNHQIEKDIQKILVFTINGTDCFEKTGVYWYYTFKLNCWWRIIWYPNWEIFTICSHTDYDHIRDCVEPPKDKAI